MGRVCILIGMILMASALSLVTARYQARQLYDQLDKYKAKSRELEIEWRKLQLDRAAESSNSKVDRLAREELKMTGIVPDRTVYITQPSLSQKNNVAPARGAEPTGAQSGAQSGTQAGARGGAR